MTVWPLGVFASIDAGLGVHLEVAQELEVPTIQLHAPSTAQRTAEAAAAFRQRLQTLHIEITAVFGGFAGESYADIPTVADTVGLVPPSTRAARLQEMREISDFARSLQCGVVGLHLGFVPHDTGSQIYRDVLIATQQLCEHAKANRQSVHLETGQETVPALIQFIDDVNRDNLFVNFDPANMILYGTGEPIAALQQLGSRVRSVHCKDAVWSSQPGVTWGREVPLGEGSVDFEKFLSTLKAIGYRGPLTIEREIPQEPTRQKAEVQHAVELLRRISKRLWQ